MRCSGNRPSAKSGFTVLELMVAVGVTALLAGVMLTVSTQVMQTQRVASGDLETNQVAQFVLDRMQEDLQCALYRNDGNTWMAISLLETKDNSGSWRFVSEGDQERGKPLGDSLRIVEGDWPEREKLSEDLYDHAKQAPMEMTRSGVGGTWLRFFTQGPELDQSSKNLGAARAVAYQIIRYPLTGSKTSSVRYQLFRSDVSAKNTFEAGYDFHPSSGSATENYYKKAGSVSLDAEDPNNPRIPSTIVNPIIGEATDFSPTSFSLAANVVDLGIRAYLIEKNSFGTGNLVQIFPAISDTGVLQDTSFYATSNPANQSLEYPYHAFPDVIDISIRILTTEGARLLGGLEGSERLSNPESIGGDWWSVVEKHSQVYMRRVKIYGKGI